MGLMADFQAGLTMGMTHEFMQCQGREIHFTQWGHAHRETVVLWHGLSRTGRDFDALAEHLAEQASPRYRVLCPDTPGRGLSQWAADPAREYSTAFYCACAVALLDRLGLKSAHWVGTSMGGRLGITLAAGPLAGRISRLVLNDIGPEVPPAALQHIAERITELPTFDSVAAYEQWLRQNYASFGPLSDTAWRHMATHSHRRRDDGRITVHYDPQLARQFASAIAAALAAAPPVAGQGDLWPDYERVRCPTLLIRGAQSDVLTAETAQAMTQRGPKCQLRTVAECGHAPLLDVPHQMALVTEFLKG